MATSAYQEVSGQLSSDLFLKQPAPPQSLKHSALFLTPNISHLSHPAEKPLYPLESGKISHFLSKVQSVSVIFNLIYPLLLSLQLIPIT